jgi:hypothetical protein
VIATPLSARSGHQIRSGASKLDLMMRLMQNSIISDAGI